MERVAASVEMRKHARARIELPVRIRWRGPLGMSLEQAKTIDVSREGLSARCTALGAVAARVWLVFPFDPANGVAAGPEIPARIVRTEKDLSGGCRVAVRFESSRREKLSNVGPERRRAPRTQLALPMFVRSEGAPWPEESMTQDVSSTGARFETSRIYAQGDAVRARIPVGRWADGGELSGRVVRVQAMEDVPGPAPIADPQRGASVIFTAVAVQWNEPKSSAAPPKAKP